MLLAFIEPARRLAATGTDTAVASLAPSPGNAALRLFCRALQAFARHAPINESARRVLTLPFEEQRLYVERLLAANVARGHGAASDGEPVYEHVGRLGITARYNQLPCTPTTRRDRADLLERAGLIGAPVVLLGDDDLVSVELSQRGFHDITVADCDETLLGVIKVRTAGAAHQPALIKADFVKGFKAERPAAAVCLDPPYNPEAVKLFLRVAFANVDAATPHALYLMYNPYLVGASGRAEIEAALEAQGYTLKKRLEAFNSYPVNRVQSSLLKLAGLCLLGRLGRVPRGRRLHYFSDCFVWERKPGTV